METTPQRPGERHAHVMLRTHPRNDHHLKSFYFNLLGRTEGAGQHADKKNGMLKD